MTTPRFAVVGHPNKGKSSIVATLAEDDSVAVSPLPGTTVECRQFPMIVDNETLYILIDTPGFQRARRALAWMQAHSRSAADRPAVVRQFIDAFKSTGKFTDECELLTPISDGAAILYVVDGSRPYGAEYEAEMEILRWTGRPSMALINMIGDADYSDEWRDALGQYFRIVREFNALTAEFTKRLELLKGFGELNEAWRAPLTRAVTVLTADREAKRRDSAHTIAGALADMITYIQSVKTDADEDPDRHKPKLLERYKRALQKLESTSRRNVERIYDYDDLKREELPLDADIDSDDLFSEDTWLLWGLNSKQLVTTSALGGAAVGGTIDIASGGTSFLLGSLIGGIVGGASALFTADKLTKIDILGLPLGGNELRAGPMQSVNLPYVILARALFHHAMVSARTHAERKELNLIAVPGERQYDLGAYSADQFSARHRQRLESNFKRLRNQPEANSQSVINEIADIVVELMQTPNNTRDDSSRDS